MGYTTKFKGQFKLNKQLDMDTFLRFKNVLNEDSIEYKENGFKLDGYCQWAPNKDATAIQWDGNEKFYNYKEWLRYVIQIELAPKGYVLNGKVIWSGEETDDVGVIVVTDNKIVAQKQEFELIMKCPHCNEDIFKPKNNLEV